MTACGVAVEEVAFSDSRLGRYVASGYMDIPDVGYEILVTWLTVGDDRVVSRLTPDGDHYVGLMAGASAGPLWVGGCDSNDVCDVVPNGIVLDRGARCSTLLSLINNDSRSRPMVHRLLRDGTFCMRRDVRDSSRLGDGSIRDESGQVESPDSEDFWCLSDPLGGVFGRIMVSSLVLCVVRWWWRSQP